MICYIGIRFFKCKLAEYSKIMVFENLIKRLLNEY